MTLMFFAEGIPQAQGSMKGYARRVAPGRVRAIIRPDNEKLMPWRESVRDAARRALAAAGFEGQLLAPTGVVRLDVTFLAPAPKDVAKKLLKGRAVSCAKGRDLDKLLRGVFDALSSLVYADDRQVDEVRAVRRYQHPAKPPGVHVVVTVAEALRARGEETGR